MCVPCGTHFRLRDTENGEYQWQFFWDPEGDPVGSDAEEAAEWFAWEKAKEAQKQAGAGI
jgi:hypothetical protein